MEERWKPLYYHGEYFGDTYFVSDFGRLKNIKTGLIRKLNFDKDGYTYVTIDLYRRGSVYIKMHRAVAENFIDGDKSLHVNHKDGNKSNNHYTNLEYVTLQENFNHAIKHELTKAVITHDDVKEMKRLRENGVSYKEMSEIFGVTAKHIQKILSGKSHSYAQNIGLC